MLRRAAALLLGALALSGCTEDALVVEEAGLGVQEAEAVLTGPDDAPRTVFYTDDEAVTLAVSWDVNFVGVYLSYYAWWYFPDGRVYLRQPVRNKFGSHLSLVTSMAIRGEPPAERPGLWRMQLTLRDRLLLEREFEIREGPRPVAAPAPAEQRPPEGDVQPPAAPEYVPGLCPDAGSPPGRCNWEASEEGFDGVRQSEPLKAGEPARTPVPAAPAPPSTPPAAQTQRQPAPAPAGRVPCPGQCEGQAPQE